MQINACIIFFKENLPLDFIGIELPLNTISPQGKFKHET